MDPGIRDLVLELVEVLREFNFEMPQGFVIRSDLRFEIECALFTFDYIRTRPVAAEARSYGYMSWRPRTHYASQTKLKQRVVTALLCFKRACPRLPRDIRHILLIQSFGREIFRVDKDNKMKLLCGHERHSRAADLPEDDVIRLLAAPKSRNRFSQLQDDYDGLALCFGCRCQ